MSTVNVIMYNVWTHLLILVDNKPGHISHNLSTKYRPLSAKHKGWFIYVYLLLFFRVCIYTSNLTRVMFVVFDDFWLCKCQVGGDFRKMSMLTLYINVFLMSAHLHKVIWPKKGKFS
jgi:hypothetical protein